MLILILALSKWAPLRSLVNLPCPRPGEEIRAIVGCTEFVRVVVVAGIRGLHHLVPLDVTELVGECGEDGHVEIISLRVCAVVCRWANVGVPGLIPTVNLL